MKKLIYCYSLFCLSLLNCSEKDNTQNRESNSPKETVVAGSLVNEGFDEFYKKFLEDSVFQISRIQFPLGGEKITNDKTSEWSRDNWITMKASVFEIDTTEFKVEIEKSDSLNTFKVFIPNSGFELIMKFKLIDTRWYLVYCKDMFS